MLVISLSSLSLVCHAITRDVFRLARATDITALN
jgi:hypothetical protein